MVSDGTAVVDFLSTTFLDDSIAAEKKNMATFPIDNPALGLVGASSGPDVVSCAAVPAACGLGAFARQSVSIMGAMKNIWALASWIPGFKEKNADPLMDFMRKADAELQER